MGAEIASANYQQEPIDTKGRLYSGFKTYDSLPKSFDRIASYTDTADTGSDYLCSINYGVYHGEAYVLDVLYTKDAMEITEPATARLLFDGNVNAADIESNNGARILSNSTWVMEHIYVPANWRDRFPEFYDAMNRYQKEGKNAHDDAPDAVTGIAEKLGKGSTFSFD